MLAFLLGQPVFGNLQWCLRDVWLGFVARLPLLALFFLLLHSSLPVFKRIGEFSRPTCGPFSAVGNLATGGHLATGRRVRGGVFS